MTCIGSFAYGTVTLMNHSRSIRRFTVSGGAAGSDKLKLQGSTMLQNFLNLAGSHYGKTTSR